MYFDQSHFSEFPEECDYVFTVKMATLTGVKADIPPAFGQRFDKLLACAVSNVSIQKAWQVNRLCHSLIRDHDPVRGLL